MDRAERWISFFGYFALAMLLGYALPPLLKLTLPYENNILAGFGLFTGIALSQLYWVVLWRAGRKFGRWSILLLVGAPVPLIMSETLFLVWLPMEIGLARERQNYALATALELLVTLLLLTPLILWVRCQYRQYRKDRDAEAQELRENATDY
jgi:hypothetical protein